MQLVKEVSIISMNSVSSKIKDKYSLKAAGNYSNYTENYAPYYVSNLKSLIFIPLRFSFNFFNLKIAVWIKRPNSDY